MKRNQICKFMIFLIVIIVKHENAVRCMYGSDGRNKWYGKQHQLSLSWADRTIYVRQTTRTTKGRP